MNKTYKQTIYYLTVLFILFVNSAYAREMRYLVRSPKALLMGDAYTARTDDEYVLFYNPAAIGRNSDLTFAPINPDFGTPDPLTTMEKVDNFPDETTEIAESLTGFPIFVHGGAVPTVQFGPFAVSLFYTMNTNFIIRNAIHPVLELDYRLDRGMAFGYAYSWGSAGKRKKGGGKTTGDRLSIGAGIKRMNRQGLNKSFQVFGTELMNSIEAADGGDYHAIRKELGYSIGSAWGFDTGFEYVHATNISELAFGFSVLDVGDTSFDKTEGDEDVPTQEMMIATGLSWKQDFWLVDYAISADLHPLVQDIPLMRKVHLGAELGIPLIRLMCGFNAGYFSYGLKFRLWPITLTVGIYGIEVGHEYRAEESRRAEIYLSLLDFQFDA